MWSARTSSPTSAGRGERRWESRARAPGDDVARLRSVRVVPSDGGSADEIDIRQPIDIEVEYWSDAPGALRPSVNLHFYNDEGVCLFVIARLAGSGSLEPAPRQPGVVRSTCTIPGNFLAEGRVVVTVFVATFDPVINHAEARDAVAFQVVDRSEGDAVRGTYGNEWPGVVRPLLDWRVDTFPAATDELAGAGHPPPSARV